MRNNVIPLGPSEVVAGAATISVPALYIEAEVAMVITAITFMYPASPANPQQVTSFTLPVGGHLFNVKSLTMSAGQAFIVYLGNVLTSPQGALIPPGN